MRVNLLFGFVDGSLPCPAAEIANPAAAEDGATATIPNPLYSACLFSGVVSDAIVNVLSMVISLGCGDPVSGVCGCNMFVEFVGLSIDGRGDSCFLSNPHVIWL